MSRFAMRNASARPAAVPPVPSGTTMRFGCGKIPASICATSSRPAFTCPSIPSGLLPPAGIHRAPRRRCRSAQAYAPSGDRKIGARSVLSESCCATRVAVAFISCFQRPTNTRAPNRAPYTATASACVDPADPTVTSCSPGCRSASRNSNARVLLPPIGSAQRSSRFIHNDGATWLSATTGVGYAPNATRGTRASAGNRATSGRTSTFAVGLRLDALVRIVVGADLWIAHDVLDVQHLHAHNGCRQQWYGAHQAEEAEEEGHQRL